MLRAEIENISIKNESQKKTLLKNIFYEVFPNKVYTILGDNGSGKSTLIKSFTQLLDKNDFEVSGKVLWKDKNVLEMNDEELMQIRKNEIRYVFQDSVNSFDPLKKIRYYFNSIVKDDAKLSDLLEYFNLPPKEKLENLYPYELSGGMAQRILIVLTVSANPELLILDEPTSAADTAVINLLIHFLRDYIKNGEKSVLIVTQDLLFAKKVSDDIVIIKDCSLSEFEFNKTGKL